MKTVRKLLSGVVIFMMLLTGNAFAHTMYSLDGRNIEVSYDDAQIWRNVGWYDEPVQMMYAPDGRTVVIYKSQVSAWQKVGWYTYPIKKISAYKNEYAYVLKQKLAGEYSTEKSFSLVYIDGDDIPELIYRYSECHAIGAEVFTFSNGRAVSLGVFGEFGDIYYYPYANRFTSQYWGMGGEYISLYKISASSAKKLVELNGYKDYLYGNKSDFNVNGIHMSYSSYISTKKSYGLGGEYGNIASPYRRSMDTNKYPLTEYNISVVLG